MAGRSRLIKKKIDSQEIPGKIGTRMAANPPARFGPLVRYFVFSLIVFLAAAAVFAWILQSWLGPVLTSPGPITTIWVGAAAGSLLLFAALFVLTLVMLGGLVRRGQAALQEPDVLEKAKVAQMATIAAEREQRRLAETLAQVALTLSESLELRVLLDSICNEGIKVFKANAAYLWLVDRDDLVGFAAQGEGKDEFIGLRFPLADPKLLGAQVIREHKPLIVNNAPQSYLVNPKLVQIFSIQSMLGIPLMQDGRPIGALTVLDTRNPQRFRAEDAPTAMIFSNHAVVAIGNAQLYEKAQRRWQHQQALHEIDRAISSGAPLDSMLEVVLQKTMQELGVDAASILLFDPGSQTLKYQGGRGFRTYRALHTILRLDDEYAGRAVREQTTISLQGLEDAQPPFERYSLIAGENFICYHVTPLIIKDEARGVLEVFHRTPLRADDDWLEFFETLAGQTAIALEDASLFSELRQANAELVRAYDATVQGWGAALELRDLGTAGHTQRVTEMTDKLARFMGVPEEQLVHIHRGALLHDIGEMGVPDSILLKSEKLSKPEQEAMHQHTQHAFDMLSRIPYLSQVLDIPYCHHENWDGSGYPRGLKHEEIPLAARIFAVADVYDALTSDRPYRQAWSKEQALAYLKDKSGKQFDPLVVTSFLKLSADGKL